MKNIITLTSAYMMALCLLLNACTKPGITSPDTAKELIDLVLKNVDGSSFADSSVSISFAGNNLDITLPYYANLNELIPVVKIKGVSVSPASGSTVSFKNPVTFTITAEDSSTAAYTVTVHLSTPPIVYAGGSDNLFDALNAYNGQVIWQYGSSASFVYSRPCYANGAVYVGGSDNNLYAFDALTGHPKWKKTISTSGIEGGVAYADGLVYVGTDDDVFYAFDATNGDLKWSFQTGGNISSTPVVANGIVYVGSDDENLYALNATTGNLIWRNDATGMSGRSGPVLADGVLYVGSRNGYLRAVDANTGQQKWQFYANGISLEHSCPAVADNMVYVGGSTNIPNFNEKGSLYAVNAQTGELVWEKLKSSDVYSNPCVANGIVYVAAADLMLHALDAKTGSTVWERRLISNSASPAVYNGTVYIGDGGNGYFYALDAADGHEKWKFHRPFALDMSAPLIVPPPNK